MSDIDKEELSDFEEEMSEEELRRLIEEEHKCWEGMLIILTQAKQVQLFSHEDGTLGLGFIDTGLGGYGGAIGPTFGGKDKPLKDIVETVLEWMGSEDSCTRYEWKPPFTVIKLPGEMTPYTNEVENLYRRRLEKSLKSFDIEVLKVLFKGRFTWTTMTFEEIAIKLKVSPNRVKESCEKMQKMSFVNIWYPAKHEVHIWNRGNAYLIEHKLVKEVK